METEREIIYTMLSVINKSEYNNDEPLGDRILRRFLQKYRADLLRKHYNNGINVDPEVFQKIELSLKPVPGTNYEFELELPKIIRFKQNTGYYIECVGRSIPIMDPEAYRYSKQNFNTSFLPKAKVSGNKITLYIGNLDNDCIVGFSELAALITSLGGNLTVEAYGEVSIDLFCVLNNPSDDPNYDWKTSIYPFPAERINEMMNQIYSKEYGILVDAKSDEIQNTRQDYVRYHDQDDLSSN